MIIDGQIVLDVAVDGVSLPLEIIGCPYIQIDTSRELGLPVLTMNIVDPQFILRSLTPLQDGTLIAVSIGVSEGSKNVYEFRTTSVHERNGMFTISGYLNAPRFVGSTLKKAMRGTSAEVIRQLCKMCGLDCDVVDTNDSQLWFPNNERIINFVRRIVAHAQVDSDSIMRAYISAEGVLYMSDLNKIQDSAATFGYRNGIPLSECTPFSTGSKNIFGGYSKKFVIQTPSGNKLADSMTLSKMASSFNAHPRMAAFLEDSITDFSPIVHPANVHSNFLQARYRNARGSALMSTVGVSIAYPARTTVHGLQFVGLDLTTESSLTQIEAEQQINNGNWWVLNKSIYVENAKYFERLELRRNGYEVKNEQRL